MSPALAAFQDRFESVPAEWDDTDSLTEADADELAADELMATGAVVADTLCRICDPVIGRDRPGYTPTDVQAIERDAAELGALDTHDMAAHTLLAVAMTGAHRNALSALLTLRDRVQAGMLADIQQRAAELMKEAA